MKSYTTDRFWKCYTGLPVDIKKRAKTTYKVFQNDPYHPSLHLKESIPAVQFFLSESH